MKKPGLGIMIVEHSRPMNAPPRYGSKSGSDAGGSSSVGPSASAPRGKGGVEGGDPTTDETQDPDKGRAEQSVTVSPEAVDYHDSSEACDVCEYWAGGECRVLKMQVDPKGHCEAFEAKAGAGAGAGTGGDEDMTSAMPHEMEMSQ